MERLAKNLQSLPLPAEFTQYDTLGASGLDVAGFNGNCTFKSTERIFKFACLVVACTQHEPGMCVAGKFFTLLGEQLHGLLKLTLFQHLRNKGQHSGKRVTSA